MTEHIVLHHDDVNAVNTEEDPHKVAPASCPLAQPDGGKAEVELLPLSWNVIRFSREGK